MILFDKRCEVCSRPTSDKYVNEIDGHIICIRHFRMLLEAGLLYEGQDDRWHFLYAHEKDIEELIKLL